MKKILVILSSPRAGNSTYAAKEFAKALKGSKTFADINLLRVKPCTACGKCEDEFICVYNDDAAGLIRKVEKSGVVIVAAPVYFTGVPAPLKAFIDRNQPQWEKRKSGARNPEKDQDSRLETRDSRPKTGVIILTAGHNKSKYFKPAESEIRSFFAVNNIRTKLVMKFGNMDEKNAMRKYSAKIKAAARKLKNG